jgi:predicted DNA-binding transcriptional regulator AlpA
MSKKSDEPRPLVPDQIYRWKEGWKFFGYGATQLEEKIEAGEIPAPIPLSDTGRAKGWLGRTIIEWQADQVMKAPLRREAEAKRNAARNAVAA